jgi:hypothetical protein
MAAHKSGGSRPAPKLENPVHRSVIPWQSIAGGGGLALLVLASLAAAWVVANTHRAQSAAKPVHSAAESDKTGSEATRCSQGSATAREGGAGQFQAPSLAAGAKAAAREAPVSPPPPAKTDDEPFASAPATRNCPTADTYGTQVKFLASPAEAAAQARKDGKLLFVLHVSGNFEDSRFT